MKILKALLPFFSSQALFSTLLVVMSSAPFFGCNTTPPPNTKDNRLTGDLIIFHAGSLSVPIKALADSFQKLHPAVSIKPESAGSLTSIRKISELGRPCDILASADAVMIDKMMIPELASWNMEIAVNEMSVAFNDKSAKADIITVGNWPEILADKSVRIGRADPASDPCGYRTVLSLKLADALYPMPKESLSEKLLRKDNRFIRPKEMDLLALLETNTIDYIFIYRSVALQHNLRFIDLPDSISLSNPALAEWYNTVSVTIPGNAPGETIQQPGEPMVYGITIPTNAPNPEVAKEFIRFVYKDGAEIIRASKQEPLTPARFSAAGKKPGWL